MKGFKRFLLNCFGDAKITNGGQQTYSLLKIPNGTFTSLIGFMYSIQLTGITGD